MNFENKKLLYIIWIQCLSTISFCISLIGYTWLKNNPQILIILSFISVCITTMHLCVVFWTYSNNENFNNSKFHKYLLFFALVNALFFIFVILAIFFDIANVQIITVFNNLPLADKILIGTISLSFIIVIFFISVMYYNIINDSQQDYNQHYQNYNQQDQNYNQQNQNYNQQDQNYNQQNQNYNQQNQSNNQNYINMNQQNQNYFDETSYNDNSKFHQPIGRKEYTTENDVNLENIGKKVHLKKIEFDDEKKY